MIKLKKGISAALALALITGTGACGGGERTQTQAATTSATENTVNELDDVIDFADLADIEEIDEKNEEGTGPLYVPGKKAETVKALCYYDLNDKTPNLAKMLAERFGGTVEMIEITTSLTYFEKLGVHIASGDSPDLVRYDWQSHPYGTVRNMYTALDGWLDMDSPLWVGEKDVIEQFSVKGNHYYFPEEVMPAFSLHYNRLVLQEAGLEDPLDLYDRGEWDWNAFEQMMRKWVSQGDDYTGLRGNRWSALMFVNTTGQKVIDMNGSEFVNNSKNVDVQRAMDWLSEMFRQNLIGDGWIEPSEAFVDGKILFLAMECDWAFGAAQEGLFNKGIDYDIAFVPIPRDPQSDRYYQAADSAGYMVAAGAKNIQGAVDYILCSRIYKTDPEVVAADRAEKTDPNPTYYPKCPQCKYSYTENNTPELTVCPECGTARKRKFKAYYSERQLAVREDMTSTEKFGLIYDSAKGLGEDFNNIFVSSPVPADALLDGPIYHGASYTQLRDMYYNVMESYLDEYREMLKAD